jgi:hypothetical protein
VDYTLNSKILSPKFDPAETTEEVVNIKSIDFRSVLPIELFTEVFQTDNGGKDLSSVKAYVPHIPRIRWNLRYLLQLRLFRN